MNNYLTITLPKKVTVLTLGRRSVEIDKIEIYEIVDNYSRKTITAITKNHPTRIMLWEGEQYNAIGQWTDTDVTNRVLELYAK